MRKGDMTRQEILRVSENLFLQKGYEQTSIQDILDVTHGSKGSFYHHFPSKDSVLQTLCGNRADRARMTAEQMLKTEFHSMERLNCLITCALPLRREESPFMSMILPLMELPEGMTVRVVYQDALVRSFSPLLNTELIRGRKDGSIFPCTGDLAVPLLTLLNAFWQEACGILMEMSRTKNHTSAAMMQTLLARYRLLTEHMLNAPYGSILLISLSQWEDFSGRVLEGMQHS